MIIGQLQAILSIIIVATFVVVSAIIALTPVLGGYPAEGYAELLKSYTSIFSGIIGIIVGYFFGIKSVAKE